ncbi:DciA family protein [Pseudothermotoga elfii]|jgi:predicted nucleic acid-binding Zn ribbon protein
MKKINEIFDMLSFKDPLFKELKLRSFFQYELSSFLGESLARHCKFLQFKEGVLYLECDDPIWLTEANFMKRKIKDKINELFHQQMVKDIVLRRCKL